MSDALKAHHARPATAGGVFALRGRDRQSLVVALERIAALAPRMSHHELQNLSHYLYQEMTSASAAAPSSGGALSGSGGERGTEAGGRSQALAEDGEIRVAVTASNGDQLAERACHAARLVRVVRVVRGGALVREAGVLVSGGARGRVVLVFPSDAVTDGAVPEGSAWAAAEAARLARSLDGLRRLQGLGVSDRRRGPRAR
jgi:hypothetical protein